MDTYLRIGEYPVQSGMSASGLSVAVDHIGRQQRHSPGTAFSRIDHHRYRYPGCSCQIALANPFSLEESAMSQQYFSGSRLHP